MDGSEYGSGFIPVRGRPKGRLVCEYCRSLPGEDHKGFCLTVIEGATERWDVES